MHLSGRLTRASVPALIALCATGPWLAADAGRDFHPTSAATGDLGLIPLFSLGGSDPAGQFRRPESIAVSPDGTVWVTDTGNHRLQRFTAQGDLLTVVGGPGTAPGRLATPRGISSAPDGSVWVADHDNRRLQRFASDGRTLAVIAMPPDPAGTVGRAMPPTDVAVAPDGTLYASTLGRSDTIVRFAPDGRVLASWPGQAPSLATGAPAHSWAGAPSAAVADRAWSYHYLEVGPDGSVYLSGGGGVLRFDADGRYLNTVAALGAQPEQVEEWPGDVATAPDGTLLVADHDGDRVVRLRADGTLVDAWGVPGTSPLGLAVHPDGTVYLSIPGTDQRGGVLRMTTEGQVIERWGLPHADEIPAPALPGVAVAADGTVWASDPEGGRLRHYGPQGAFLGTVAQPGSGRRQLLFPAGLAATNSGLYVADAGNHRVQVFDQAGGWRQSYGRFGHGPGGLDGPGAVAIGVTLDGYPEIISIADRGNHRVTMFRGQGHLYGYFGTLFAGQPWVASALALVPPGYPGSRSRYLAAFLAIDRVGRRVLVNTLGSAGWQPWPFAGDWAIDPADLAVGPGYQVAVVDAGRRTLTLAQAANGAHQRDILGPDTLLGPAAVAWTPNGDLVVRDLGAARFVRTDVSGTIQATWPWLDSRDGRFVAPGPSDVAFTTDGGLVMADGPTSSLQRFAADGAFLARWPMPADGADPWRHLPAVAAAPDGTNYAVATGNTSRVVRFDAAGQVVGGWPLATETGAGPPVDIVVEPQGTVAILMAGPGRVQRYDADGGLLDRWLLADAWPLSASGAALSATPEGDLLVLQGRDAVVAYTPDGQLLKTWYIALTQPFSIHDMTVAADGSLYFVGEQDYEPFLAHYDRLGTPLGLRPVTGDCGGAFRAQHYYEAYRVSAGAGAQLAVGGRDGRCVQVYGTRPIDTWRAEHFADPWLTERPLAIQHLAAAALDLAWGEAGPAPPLVPPRGFSARFERDLTLAAPGGLAVRVAAVGGVRLWLDDELVVDAPAGRRVDMSHAVAAGGGRHRLRVEYADVGETARLSVEVTAGPTPTPVPAQGRGPAYLPLLWATSRD